MYIVAHSHTCIHKCYICKIHTKLEKKMIVTNIVASFSCVTHNSFEKSKGKGKK